MKKPTLPDATLIDVFQNTNSDQSFEALYTRYVNKVYRKCLSMTKNSEDAQDYTQEIFIKVFAKLHTFQQQSSFSTWLYSITNHYCLDQLRIGKRMSSESLSDALNDNLADTDQADLVEAHMQLLEMTLEELSEEEIKLLRLKYEQGLSIQAISQQYNLTESAVKMRLKRTRDRLQTLYSNSL